MLNHQWEGCQTIYDQLGYVSLAVDQNLILSQRVVQMSLARRASKGVRACYWVNSLSKSLLDTEYFYMILSIGPSSIVAGYSQLIGYLQARAFKSESMSLLTKYRPVASAHETPVEPSRFQRDLWKKIGSLRYLLYACIKLQLPLFNAPLRKITQHGSSWYVFSTTCIGGYLGSSSIV
jgi:hypothetical protein